AMTPSGSTGGAGPNAQRASVKHASGVRAIAADCVPSVVRAAPAPAPISQGPQYDGRPSDSGAQPPQGGPASGRRTRGGSVLRERQTQLAVALGVAGPVLSHLHEQEKMYGLLEDLGELPPGRH